MTDFEKACELANKQWVNSFDEKTDENIKFSHSHEKRIKEIAQIADGKKRIKLTRKTLKYIIIAAVLLALAATTAIATPHFKKYRVEKSDDLLKYSVSDGKSSKIDKEPSLEYIPNGYHKVSQSGNEDGLLIEYRKDEDHWFTFMKNDINSNIYFSDDENKLEKIEYNGTKYLIYSSDKNVYGIIWNDGKYSYDLGGNLSKEELLRIAKCTK